MALSSSIAERARRVRADRVGAFPAYWRGSNAERWLEGALLGIRSGPAAGGEADAGATRGFLGGNDLLGLFFSPRAPRLTPSPFCILLPGKAERPGLGTATGWGSGTERQDADAELHILRVAAAMVVFAASPLRGPAAHCWRRAVPCPSPSPWPCPCPVVPPFFA